MRVAHLLPTLEIGGRERSAIDLARAGRALGLDTVLVTHGTPVPGRALLDSGDVPVVPLSALGGVDLIHAHGHLSAIPAAASGSPALATIHVALGSGWRWAWPVARALRRMAAVTAVSEDLARRFGPLAGRHIETIATVTDPARIVPARGSGGRLRIAMVARLHPVKRHRDALAAMTLLAARGVPAELVIAGDGPLAGELARAVAGRDDVVLAGPVSDVPALLAGCDVFLLPSDHEGTPVALLEAMAAGLPCVATRVGGVPALAGAGSGVTLVPRRNPAALASALAALLDPVARKQAGAAARARAARFTLDATAQRYCALYAKLVAS